MLIVKNRKKLNLSEVFKSPDDLVRYIIDINDKINPNNVEIIDKIHNGKYTLLKKGGGLWLYDFVDIRNQKIIEYNGDQYHANPSKFSSDDTPHPFRKHITAKEIWLKDEEKISTAKENKFDVLVIWDSEYRWGDKNRVIDKCLEFLGLKD